MKKKPTKPPSKVVGTYLTPAQYDLALAAVRKSMCKSLSAYGRKLFVQQPVTMQYRNRSADDAVEANIALIALLRTSIDHPSWTPEEKDWLKVEIGKIEHATLQI